MTLHIATLIWSAIVIGGLGLIWWEAYRHRVELGAFFDVPPANLVESLYAVAVGGAAVAVLMFFV